MRLPADLAAQFRRLAAHSQPPHDIGRTLEELLVLAVVAVPSCLAISLTLHDHGQRIMVAAHTEANTRLPVASSLAIELPDPEGLTSDPAGRVVLTLYASAQGALRQTASELLTLLDLDPRRANLDTALQLPTGHGAASDLAATLDGESAINQALGVLLDRHGLLAAQGREELTRLAAAENVDVPSAARCLLRDLLGDPPGGATIRSSDC